MTNTSALTLADLMVRPRALLESMTRTKHTVRLGDHRFEVGSNDDKQLAYLRSLFVPANSLWAVEPHSHESRTAVGLALPETDFRALADELVRRSGPATQVSMHVNAPALQYRLADGTQWTVAESTSDVEGPVLIVHSGQGLVGVSTDHPYGYLNFARQLREYGYRRAEDASWVSFHASCAELPDGGGALIVGRSAAGKSTVALCLAMAPGGGFIANDRVMVRADLGVAGTLRATAMPVPIRLNAGTVKALGLEAAVGWDLMRPQPDYRNSDWGRFGGDSKLSVLPAEWHERTGTRLVEEAPVEVVILPRAQPTAVEIKVRVARPADVAEVLTEQCMAPDDEIFVEDWLGVRRAARADRIQTARRTVDSLMRRPVLTVEFGLGTGLPELASAIAETVRTLR